MNDQDYNLFFDISQSLTSIAETLDRIAEILEKYLPQNEKTDNDERSK